MDLSIQGHNWYSVIGLLVVLIAIIYCIVQAPKFTKKITDNLNFVAKLINGTVKNRIFRRTVEGFYKGRKIRFDYESGGDSSNITALITPLSMVQDQKKFLITYPKPTENTELYGKLVRWNTYLKPKYVFKDLSRWSEQELLGIFEELTRAAEIVETKKPFYKN